MAKRPPNPDRFLTSTVWERTLCRIGVPPEFWEVNEKAISYMKTEVGKDQLSATAQRQWVRAYLKHPPRRNVLITIASSPTDTEAMKLAIFMLEYMYKKGKNCAVVDVALPNKYFDVYPDCVVLHNIMQDATNNRREAMRDAVLRFKTSFTIIVTASITSPYKWTIEKLGVRPEMVFKVKENA